jgi:hypothetical protein
MAISPMQAALATAIDELGGNGSAYVRCQRKKRFPSLAEAMQFGAKAAPKNKSFRVRVYPCDLCKGFHLCNIVGEQKSGMVTKAAAKAKQSRAEVEVLRETSNNQMKRILELQKEVVEAKAKLAMAQTAVPVSVPCDCLRCQLSRWWKRKRGQDVVFN